MNKKEKIIGGAILVGIATLGSAATYFIKEYHDKNTIYKYAASLFENEDYDVAASVFETLEGFKNSAEYATLCEKKIILDRFDDLIKNDEFEEARNLLESKKLMESVNMSQAEKDKMLCKLHKAIDDSAKNEKYHYKGVASSATSVKEEVLKKKRESLNKALERYYDENKSNDEGEGV